MRILLIGEKHKEVTDSFNWISCEDKCPVFGDYDHVILYMPTLAEYELTMVSDNLFQTISANILNAINNNTSIFVVTAPHIASSTLSNYSIFPFKLYPLNHGGKVYTTDNFQEYFSNVKSWDFYFKSLQSPVIKNDRAGAVKWELTEIAKTRHGGLIAFVVTLNTYRYSNSISTTEPIVFLPPQSNVEPQNMILQILKIISHDKYEIPEFIDEITVPGERNILKQIDNNKKIIAEAQESLETTEKEYKKLRFMKGILALKDKALVRSVVKVCAEMKIKLEGTDTYEEDKTYVSGKNSIPVEIKGHKKAVTEKDLLQIMGRTNKAKVVDENFTRGILIANPYCEMPLAERGKDFEPGIEKKAAVWGVCLLSTKTLFSYWVDFRKTGSTDLADKLLTTHGILKHASEKSEH